MSSLYVCALTEMTWVVFMIVGCREQSFHRAELLLTLPLHEAIAWRRLCGVTRATHCCCLYAMSDNNGPAH